MNTPKILAKTCHLNKHPPSRGIKLLLPACLAVLLVSSSALAVEIPKTELTKEESENVLPTDRLCSPRSRELRHPDPITDKYRLLTDEEMRDKIFRTLIYFKIGVGPDPYRQWHKIDQKHKSNSLYICDKGVIPKEQQLHRLDFTVLTEKNLKDLHRFEFLDLRGACLRKSRFAELDLRNFNLAGANLHGSCLKGASLIGVDLTGAILERTNLQYADFKDAILDRAKLTRTNMEDAYFVGSRICLDGTVFEPQKVPALRGLDRVAGQLAKMRYETTSSGLAALRAALQEGGLREAERAITYAIEHQRLKGVPEPYRTLQYWLFYWPTGFGVTPGGALWKLLYAWGIFAGIYTLVILVPWDLKGGVWKFYPVPKESVLHFRRCEHQEPDEIKTPCPVIAAAWGAHFSLVSALRIGWRDLNFGTWLARMNPWEFTLRSTGWVRTVSTFQSVVSVYFVAMWVLTYFGRPFG